MPALVYLRPEGFRRAPLSGWMTCICSAADLRRRRSKAADGLAGINGRGPGRIQEREFLQFEAIILDPP